MSSVGRNDERVVAWISRAEFLQVYKGLYATDPFLQRTAVDRVAIWRCRALHRLPVAIDCTASLVTCTMYQNDQQSSGQHDEHHVRMTSAVALIRFVNHITEKGQNRHFAQSIHILAEEFGLPEWLVDLRHDSTHGSLPCLDLLTEGVLWALEWLRKEYWEKQVTPVETTCHGSEENSVQHTIETVLVEYTQLQFQAIQDGGTDQRNYSLKDILSELENIFPKNKAAVISCLVKDGYLVCTQDQLKALDIASDTIMSHKQLKLPLKVLHFWRPLLRLLHHLQGTQLLLKTLCTQLSHLECLSNRLRAGWISEIVTSSEITDSTMERAEHNLYRRPFEVPRSSLIELCLQQPSAYTSRLIQKLLVNSELNERTEQMVRLYRIYTGEENCLQGELNSCGENSHIYSITDLQVNQKVNTDQYSSSQYPCHSLRDDFPSSEHWQYSALGVDEDSGREENPSWQLCSDSINWDLCPLGLLPHQDPDNLNLDISVTCNSGDKMDQSADSDALSDHHMTLSEGDSDDNAELSPIVQRTEPIPTIELW